MIKTVIGDCEGVTDPINLRKNVTSDHEIHIMIKIMKNLFSYKLDPPDLEASFCRQKLPEEKSQTLVIIEKEEDRERRGDRQTSGIS